MGHFLHRQPRHQLAFLTATLLAAAPTNRRNARFCHCPRAARRRRQNACALPSPTTPRLA